MEYRRSNCLNQAKAPGLLIGAPEPVRWQNQAVWFTPRVNLAQRGGWVDRRCSSNRLLASSTPCSLRARTWKQARPERCSSSWMSVGAGPAKDPGTGSYPSGSDFPSITMARTAAGNRPGHQPLILGVKTKALPLTGSSSEKGPSQMPYKRLSSSGRGNTTPKKARRPGGQHDRCKPSLGSNPGLRAPSGHPPLEARALGLDWQRRLPPPKPQSISKSRWGAKTTSPFELYGVGRSGGWRDGGGKTRGWTNPALPLQRQLGGADRDQSQRNSLPTREPNAQPLPNSFGSWVSCAVAPIRTDQGQSVTRPDRRQCELSNSARPRLVGKPERKKTARISLGQPKPNPKHSCIQRAADREQRTAAVARAFDRFFG